jgi:hypothetical protein
VLQTPHAGSFQALDAQNPRHRFPALYCVVRRGVRDQAYDGRQDAVWHRHSTRDGLLRLPARVPRRPSSGSRAPCVAAGEPVGVAVSPVRKDGSCPGQIAPTRSRLECEARLRPHAGLRDTADAVAVTRKASSSPTSVVLTDTGDVVG